MRLINNKAGIACIIGFLMLASSIPDCWIPNCCHSIHRKTRSITTVWRQEPICWTTYAILILPLPVQPSYILSEYFFSDMSVNGRTDAANFSARFDSSIIERFIDRKCQWLITSGHTFYKGIKDANTLLTRSKLQNSMNSKRLEIEGLACFHRAFRYYRLVNQFGDIPFITESYCSPLRFLHYSDYFALSEERSERTSFCLSNQRRHCNSGCLPCWTKINWLWGELMLSNQPIRWLMTVCIAWWPNVWSRQADPTKM